MNLTRPALNSIAVLAIFVLYAPILMVVLTSFFTVRRGKIDWASFSFDWYTKLLANEGIGTAVLASLKVGIIAVALSLLLSLLFATYITLARPSRWEAGAISGLIFLPFLLPPIITGMSLLVALKEVEIERGINAVILGHVVFVLAIGFRTLQARLAALEPALLWAARDLGAGPWRSFAQVILPQLKLPLATSAIMSFAISFDETMITLFLVGDGATLPTRLYGMMRYGFTPEISALVTLVLVFTGLLTALMAWVTRGRAGGFAG
ncbi:MAG: ABC transporter permease [Pseudomonadota bacterium]